MATYEKNSNSFVEFHPFLVRVEADERTDVNISLFSVPFDLYNPDFRGIANIDVKGSPIKLHVYITQQEVNDDFHLQVFKDGWEQLEGDRNPSGLAQWPAYLTTTISEGDPPIAVG